MDTSFLEVGGGGKKAGAALKEGLGLHSWP